MDASVIAYALVALGVFAYVVLDGFGLGVGIVLALFPHAEDRDVLMRALRERNEAPLARGAAGAAVAGSRRSGPVAFIGSTAGAWLAVRLVLLVASVWIVALPAGHAAVFEPLRLPLIAMLACIVARGTASGAWARSQASTRLRDLAFIGGSAGAALFQGIALGLFVAGSAAAGARPGHADASWLAPLPLWTGLGLVALYALLGAAWLVAHTGGRLQRRVHGLVWPLTMALLTCVVLVSVWTPLRDAALASRWFDARLFLRLAPVPPLVLACAYWMHRAVRATRHDTPWFAALGLAALGYLGLLVDLWP